MGNCSFMSNPVIIGQSCLGGAIERRHMAAVRGFELKTVCAFFLRLLRITFGGMKKT